MNLQMAAVTGGLACLALVCLVGGASLDSNSDAPAKLTLWTQFKQKYGRNYANSTEEKFRLSIFLKKLREIDSHNSKPDVSYKKGLNRLSDRTPEEFRRMNGLRMPAKLDQTIQSDQLLAKLGATASVPDAMNWAEVPGVVGPVKDQGDCGSCWAFATTGLVEGQERLKKSDAFPVGLSEQQLVDCDRSGRNEGCNGGLMDGALRYIVRSEGLETEEDYPYRSFNGTDSYKCEQDKVKSFLTTKDIVKPEVLQVSEEALKETLASYGPIAIGVNALDSLEDYHGGVYYDKYCGNTSISHAVLLVGYGTSKKEGDFWIIKNSWGSDWGEEGYYRMARNRDGHCGILRIPTISIAKS